jgi:hypothetical protein
MRASCFLVLLMIVGLGGCMRAARLELHGSAGADVVIDNPCAVGIACPGAPQELDPGQSVTYAFTIQGVRWPASDPPTCQSVPLEPGLYTALVVFNYSSGIDQGMIADRQASGTMLVVWPPAD